MPREIECKFYQRKVINTGATTFPTPMGAVAQDPSFLLDPDDIPLRQLSAIKAELLEILHNQWNKRWTQNLLKSDALAAETKTWFPEVNSKKSFELIRNRPREDYSIIVQANT